MMLTMRSYPTFFYRFGLIIRFNAVDKKKIKDFAAKRHQTYKSHHESAPVTNIKDSGSTGDASAASGSVIGITLLL